MVHLTKQNFLNAEINQCQIKLSSKSKTYRLFSFAFERKYHTLSHLGYNRVLHDITHIQGELGRN